MKVILTRPVLAYCAQFVEVRRNTLSVFAQNVLDARSAETVATMPLHADPSSKTQIQSHVTFVEAQIMMKCPACRDSFLLILNLQEVIFSSGFLAASAAARTTWPVIAPFVAVDLRRHGLYVLIVVTTL